MLAGNGFVPKGNLNAVFLQLKKIFILTTEDVPRMKTFEESRIRVREKRFSTSTYVVK